MIGFPRYSPIFRSFGLFSLPLASTTRKSREELKPFDFYSFPLFSTSRRLDLILHFPDEESGGCSVGSVVLCEAYDFGILSFPRYSPICGAKPPFSADTGDSLRTDQPPLLAVPVLPNTGPEVDHGAGGADFSLGEIGGSEYTDCCSSSLRERRSKFGLSRSNLK